jgi:release factor glutamine methyltransferase
MRGTAVRDALDSAVVAIEASGSPSARLDAELLLAAALGVSRTELWTRDIAVSGPAVRTFRDLVQRRSAGHEPVAYLLGTKGFRHIDLAVDPRVLIPRPETELLVEVGLELPERARVVDVGTGSGAIALALKQERPDAHVVATDISPDALELARENAAANELEIELVEGDLLAGIAGPLDLIVSNPPYVGADELDGLEPEVRDWEPRGALVDEGQTVRLARAAQSVLGGWLVVEVHEERAQALSDDLAKLGYRTIGVGLDLAGKQRMVEAQWGVERPTGS